MTTVVDTGNAGARSRLKLPRLRFVVLAIAMLAAVAILVVPLVIYQHLQARRLERGG